MTRHGYVDPATMERTTPATVDVRTTSGGRRSYLTADRPYRTPDTVTGVRVRLYTVPTVSYDIMHALTDIVDGATVYGDRGWWRDDDGRMTSEDSVTVDIVTDAATVADIVRTAATVAGVHGETAVMVTVDPVTSVMVRPGDMVDPATVDTDDTDDTAGSGDGETWTVEDIRRYFHGRTVTT